MRRLVVTTESGEMIHVIDVEEHALVAHVLDHLRVFPTALFYVDGQLVPDGDIAAVKAAAAAAATNKPPTTEKVKDYNETLQLAFDDVRRAQVQTMRDMAECTRLFGQVLIEQQRQFADEAARQRELTRKSLADVDLLGRCVKVTEFNNVLAVADDPLARRGGSGGISLNDLWIGLQRTFLGGEQ